LSVARSADEPQADENENTDPEAYAERARQAGLQLRSPAHGVGLVLDGPLNGWTPDEPQPDVIGDDEACEAQSQAQRKQDVEKWPHAWNDTVRGEG
jgi:hypothetical protein